MSKASRRWKQEIKEENFYRKMPFSRKYGSAKKYRQITRKSNKDYKLYRKVFQNLKSNVNIQYK